MEVIGLICEYNPFHNGHLYQIKKIKEIFPNSILLVVLNGLFTERGNISIISKEDKTRLALDYGIDIILELPTIFGTQASDVFAYYSIKILNEFHINYLVFGTEDDNLDAIKKVVNIQNKDVDFNNRIKAYLDKGFNYPTALAKAININISYTPNNLLAISYLKAIDKINNKIKPFNIKRTNDYHDIKSNETIISATNIREKINNNIDISKFIPDYNLTTINKTNSNEYFNLLKYKIISTSNLSSILSVDEGLGNILKNNIFEVNNTEELTNKVKSKRYTYNKINRMFLHIMLNINRKDNIEDNLAYIKILGFNKRGQKYINTIKKDFKYPTKSYESIQFEYEKKAAAIYDLISRTKTIDFEIRNKPIIKD